MKSSLLVLLFFCAGLAVGRLEVPELFAQLPWPTLPNGVRRALSLEHATTGVLYLMLFLAGIGMGFDIRSWKVLASLKTRVLLVPLVIIVGTTFGSVLAWAMLNERPLHEVLAVGFGFGYYSLSSVIITNLADASLGSVALLSNMLRELFTLLLSPLCLLVAGKLGPLSAGGAASMDTCLPVIARYCGERYAILAVLSGMILTTLVPLLVSAMLV